MKGSRKRARYQALERHLARLMKKKKSLSEIERRFFWIRLAILIFLIIGIVLLFIPDLYLFGWGILFISMIAFTVVVLLHRRVDQRLAIFEASCQLTRSQLARMDLDWQAIPPSLDLSDEIGLTGKRYLEHPFAKDIELIGYGSLMHLVDTAHTMGGSRRLLSWFLDSSPQVPQIHSRQQIIGEMAPLYGFREKLFLDSALITKIHPHKRLDMDRVINWLNEGVRDNSLINYVVLLLILALINGSLFILNVAGILPPFWIFTLAIYAIVYNLKYRKSESLFGDAYQLGSMLENSKTLFLFLERYPYPRDGQLRTLCEPFCDSKAAPSSFVRRISRIISASSLQNNQFLWLVINAILPWGLFFAYQLDKYREELKNRMPVWLDVWYELEALNSLANFSFLNPDAVTPEIILENETSPTEVFKATDLGHPLIRDDLRVCNDFTIRNLGCISLISGSNMSGKSTFLRTIGINLTLAYAGGIASASQLRVIPFRLFTAINVLDSLSDGISYFYAEVKRLKALLDQYRQEGERPVFFLIDEIFRGTNNRERQIGSRSYLNSLVGGQGVGLISTHDLALVDLGDHIGGVTNYHFREQVINGQMVFDYRMHPGPCPTTNALRIMELEGLPVDYDPTLDG